MLELNLKEAATAIRRGDLLVYPTETYYALGCSALDAGAVHRIFAAKRRARELPLPVIIGSPDQLGLIAGELDEPASELLRKLTAAFWPGPLSIIIPAGQAVPPELCAGSGRIAVRFSSHAGAAALCLAAGYPLVSSSANISGRPPVINPADLDLDLVASLDLDVDALYDPLPRPSGGLPSTMVEIVDASFYATALEGDAASNHCHQPEQTVLRLRRVGAVSVADLRAQGFTVLES